MSKLAHFELQEEIGKGGMATVFRAYDPSLNRRVAVKLLDQDLAKEDPKFIENFLKEAQHAAAVSHPNIVQIYFIGESEGQYYLVMELLDGENLDDKLERDGALDEASVLRIAIHVTEGLKAGYVNELVHGDIKPKNIVITRSGDSKLLDFGLAKLANVEATVESDGRVWGSPYYMSPERVGTKAEDFRSDIYSLGATIFHALTGRPPFDADSPSELAAKRLNEKAPPLRRLNPDISPLTEKIVARMLEKSVFLRYLDYDSLLADLRKALDRLSGKSASAPAAGGAGVDREQLAKITRLVSTMTGPVDVPKKKSQMPLIIGIAAAAVVVLGGGAALLLKGKKAGPSPALPTPSPTPVASAAPVATPASAPIVIKMENGQSKLPPFITRYSPDAATLHLWHFKETQAPVFDAAGGTDALLLKGLRDGAFLNGDALLVSSNPDRKTNILLAAFSLADGADDDVPFSFADPATGAFTYEAVIKFSSNYDPLTPTPKGQKMQIISADNDTILPRVFQFRYMVAPKSSSPVLDFANLATGGPAGEVIAGKVPATGPNAVNNTDWFHVAVSYNGKPGTPGNVRIYWTRLTGKPSPAVLISDPSAKMSAGLAPSSTDFAIGNEGRGPAGEAFIGYISEVRISKVARDPSELLPNRQK